MKIKALILLLDTLNILLMAGLILRISFPELGALSAIPNAVFLIAWLVVLILIVVARLRLPRGQAKISWQKELFYGVFLVGLIIAVQFFGGEPPETFDKSRPIIWILLFFVVLNAQRRYKRSKDMDTTTEKK